MASFPDLILEFRDESFAAGDTKPFCGPERYGEWDDLAMGARKRKIEAARKCQSENGDQPGCSKRPETTDYAFEQGNR